MKKQISILTMLVLALFLFTSNSTFGQTGVLNPENDYLDAAPVCPAAIDLSCAVGSAVQPMPGVEYPYEISVSSSSVIYWFVTDVATIMSGPQAFPAVADIDPGDGSGDYILTADGAYGNGIIVPPATNTTTVNIAWKPFDGNANQVVLVAYAVDAAGCTDNIEVYRIIPGYSFALDLAGLLDAGTLGDSECVGNIMGASYDGTNLTVTYDENYVFFVVTAANWIHSWETNLLATTNGNSTLGAVEWAYPAEAILPAGTWNASGDPVLATQYANVNGFVDEACIIVRVPVVHGSVTENITVNETINLTVNGDMYNAAVLDYNGTYPDLEDGGAGNPCTSDLTTDNVDYNITPRPAMTAVTPAFEPKIPTGN